MQPPLPNLEERRVQLYAALAATDDFRRGSLTATYRRCGKPNCRCADRDHRGHGPRHLLTRSVAGRTEAHSVHPGPELEKVRREIAAYKRFVALSAQIIEVNEQICEARPISALAGTETEGPGEPEKGGSLARSGRSSRPS
jgi:hypothetical protein